MTRPHRRWYAAISAAAVTASMISVGATAGPAEALTDGNARLAAELRVAINQRNFADILDTKPPAAPSRQEKEGMEPVGTPRAAVKAAKPIHQQPQVDATVIELDSTGRPIAAADVLTSPQYPQGKVVPLDGNLSTDQVRYRFWDSDATWDNNHGLGKIDALPGRQNAPIDFMSPYPASVFKIIVGFGILRLVDQGKLGLDNKYAFDPTSVPDTACGGKVTKSIRQFFDEMITFSSNPSACALVKVLHQHSYVVTLNKYLASIGLPMLQINNTRKEDGGRWSGNIMSSLDTAKLLLIVNGSPGTLWKGPDGKPVTRDVLSAASRAYFQKELADQGYNVTLSTTNWCGRAYPAPGIPQLNAQRWISPTDGTMTVNNRKYGQDVRPCQASAQVMFRHKGGHVSTAGMDAGIVHSLAGKSARHYVVVVSSNLGSRYVDRNKPADPPGIYPVLLSQKYGELGRAIDGIVTRHQNP